MVDWVICPFCRAETVKVPTSEGESMSAKQNALPVGKGERGHSFVKSQNTLTEPLDESWIQRLWNWADTNHVPDFIQAERDGFLLPLPFGNGIPREREKLLSITDLNLIPGAGFDDDDNDTNFTLFELAPEIGRLVGLRRLIIEHGFLSELPAEIGNLTNLKVLIVENNFPFKIPTEIGRLINLEDLAFTCLSEDIDLPPEVWRLTNLKSVSISGNLTELSPEIENLTKLESLQLAGDQLTELPKEVINLLRLKILGIHAFGEPLNLSYEQAKWIARLKENGCMLSLSNVFFQGEPWDL